ncbi:[FeFe] hydrogenase H-cluster maturation GTPase HydF [bacterium]
MQKTPKSMRLHIGIVGRTNVGKSSFLNLITGQDVAITSPVGGTTTDVVEKPMELLPIGPVVFLDTGGLDDESDLAPLRIKKTVKVFDRSDIVVVVVEPNVWTEFEEKIAADAKEKNIPLCIVVNKADKEKLSEDFINTIKAYTESFILAESLDITKRNQYVCAFKEMIIKICPDDFINPPLLMSDLVPKGGTAVLIVPIDLEAPKGRIILPQVQVLRDVLDNDAVCIVVKESEYLSVLSNLKNPPDIVVCDSQVVLKMVKETPPNVKCTTFSILFSRYKADILEMVKGAKAIDTLQDGDKILVAETCTHHAVEDDIGRVKLPRWLKEYKGKKIDFETYAGLDYPENLEDYSLIIHCGGCMINRKYMLSRIEKAKVKNIPVTNYGLAISYVQGVFDRVLEPFI